MVIFRNIKRPIMASIKILPDNKQIEIVDGETILEASLREGIAHAHACGGNAACSTCRVIVIEGSKSVEARNQPEKMLADRLHFTSDIRLACQTKISGDVVVNRPVLDEIDEALTNKLMSGGNVSGRIGEQKKLAVMFADIESYTPFAERLPAYDVIHVLDRYFYLVGNVIKENSGRIIDYYGDGVLAVFGIKEEENPTFKAVKAGFEMFKALEKLNPYLNRMYQRGFNIRIGMHYGQVIIGTIGIEDSRKFTVIGDAVNFASRIESTNKEFGTRFLISQETYNHVKNHVEIGRTIEASVKGKKGTHNLYEVLGIRPD